MEILKAIYQAYQKAIDNPRYAEILKQNIGFRQVFNPQESDKMAAFKECVTASIFKELGISKIAPSELGLPRPEEFEKWWPPKDYKPTFT